MLIIAGCIIGGFIIGAALTAWFIMRGLEDTLRR
jgi:hypothetical protein